MPRVFSGIGAVASLLLMLVLILPGAAPLPAADAEPAGPVPTREKPVKRSGTVVGINTNAAAITIRPRVVRMSTNAVDLAAIPTFIVVYDDSTMLRKAGRQDATIADLQTNDYVFVAFVTEDGKNVATQIIWGIPMRGRPPE